MKKQKGKKNPLNVIINIMIILFTLLVVFFAWKLVQETIPYLESRKEYDDLQQFIVVEEEPVKPETVPVSKPAKEEETKKEDTLVQEEISEEKIMREAECNLNVDFESLWKVNRDIKGWLYLEALNINYPIVQGSTNEDYIYTSVKGSANSAGSIFMDYRNGEDFADPHTLIYGHNMKDGSMFGKLKKLYDQEFVDEWDAPLCFWILTPDGKYRYDIFSIHTVSAGGDTYMLYEKGSDGIGGYANTMARQTGVELPQRVYHDQDKVVTLSTCTSGDEYRLVVQGVLHE